MHEKIGELSQFNEQDLEYKGPFRNHPALLRAKAIQEVLNDGVDTNEGLVKDLSIICEQLNAEAEHAQLFDKEITIVGAPESIDAPDISIDYSNGSIAVDSSTTSVYDEKDDDEDSSYGNTLSRENNDKEVQPTLHFATGPFAGFGFRVKPSDTLDTFEGILPEDIPSYGEIVIRQLCAIESTALTELAVYVIAKIDDVAIEFTDDKMDDSLKAATERIEKYFDNPTIRDTFIDLADVFAGDELDSEKGFRLISAYTEILLNEPSLEDK